MKIAIVEDSLHLLHQLAQFLSQQKFIVGTFKDGESAVKSIPNDEYDLCIIDVNLPGIDGYEVCKKIRANSPDMLIIFLTVRDDIEDKIKGFDAGADDYLNKPFSQAELLARIKALFKRQGKRKSDIEEIAGLSIDYDSQTISYQGNDLGLTLKEYYVLEYLLRNHGLIVSKDKLSDMIWENSYDLSENILSVYIGKLRKKLQELTGQEMIKTVKNRGYIIES